jgi:hypothetical protein
MENLNGGDYYKLEKRFPYTLFTNYPRAERNLLRFSIDWNVKGKQFPTILEKRSRRRW